MKKVILNVQGMSCEHCVKTIEKSVGELKGVSAVKVQLESGKMDIEYNANELELVTIKERIEEQGYKTF